MRKLTIAALILVIGLLSVNVAQAKTGNEMKYLSTVADAKREIRDLWGNQAPLVYCLISNESNWNPNAINWRDYHGSAGNGSFGLMQIGRGWVKKYLNDNWQKALDPTTNIRLAYKVYKVSGFGAWTTYWECR